MASTRDSSEASKLKAPALSVCFSWYGRALVLVPGCPALVFTCSVVREHSRKVDRFSSAESKIAASRPKPLKLAGEIQRHSITVKLAVLANFDPVTFPSPLRSPQSQAHRIALVSNCGRLVYAITVPFATCSAVRTCSSGALLGPLLMRSCQCNKKDTLGWCSAHNALTQFLVATNFNLPGE
ncbi:hypothetical protein N657DRAFT_643850 [Parathielavia appendiculata]|uniref:Uncharacterized protein n=1 Tax=Parathielavia appendiculata TaxID=2587402 RepID=A0AAN6U2B2_9PEZI|nr:hypothetical protein N657DRAFT_643850 [Parathielavia appendiculata]